MLARRLYQWAIVWLVCVLLVVVIVVCTNFNVVVEVVTGTFMNLVRAVIPVVVYIALLVFAGRLFLQCMGIIK